MSKTLIIFLRNGTTLKFCKITEFNSYSISRLITFNYVSASEDVSREAVFDAGTIAGYAISDETEEAQVSEFDKYLEGDK